MIRTIKTYPSAQTFGFFDVELRVPWLEAKGNPSSRLDAVIDWEGFRPLLGALPKSSSCQRSAAVPGAARPTAKKSWGFRSARLQPGLLRLGQPRSVRFGQHALLEQALGKPVKGPGGRPAHDPVKMFKLLVAQRYDNLSDEQTEYQVSDRLSFQKFVGWPPARSRLRLGETVADKVPDASVPDSQMLAQKQPRKLSGERALRAVVSEPEACRNRPLSDEKRRLQNPSETPREGTRPTEIRALPRCCRPAALSGRRFCNRQKSRIRARTCLRASTHRQIEHIFGYTCLRADTHRQMNQSMKGFYLRYIGRPPARRAAQRGGNGLDQPANLIYNLARSEQVVRLKLRPQSAACLRAPHRQA